MAGIGKAPDQAEVFKSVAQSIGCDEDEARFDAALRKVARHKPVKEAKDVEPKGSGERDR